MNCPKCGIRAAKHAVSCFCGHEFVTSNTPAPKPEEESVPTQEEAERPEAEQPKESVNEADEELSVPPSSSSDGTASEADEHVDSTGIPGTSTPYTDTTAAADTEPSAPRLEESPQQFDRVGGWLLLLCVSLTILGPLATVYNLVAGYSQLQTLFESTPGLKTLYNIDSFLSVALGLFSLWAGFSLWTRMEGAVERAKKYLYAVLGYSAILYFLPNMSGLPEEMSAEMQSVMVIASTRSVIYVAIWYLYLTKSKRVRGTYPA